MVRAWQLAAAALAIIVPASGCGRDGKRVVVRGGPSLDALFTDLAQAYQELDPSVEIVLNFNCPPCVMFGEQGDSQPLDVFASLGEFEMDQLAQLGKLHLVYATEVGQTPLSLVASRRAGDVRSIADLHKSEVRRIGVGDPSRVAVGHYAREALTKAGLWSELEDRFVYSQSGCELLKWLGLGRDIDAVIVFAVCTTDETASRGSVHDFPPDLIPPVPLILGVSGNAGEPGQARRFVDFVAGPQARETLAKHHVQPGNSDD